MLIIPTASSSVLTKTKLRLINAIFRVVIIDSSFPKHRKLYVIYARNTKHILTFFFFFKFLFSIARYLLTVLTYKQCMILTLLTELYSTYKKKLIYNVRYILTLVTILYSTYNTKLAILTYNEMLTLLKVLYSTLYIYKTATCTTYITDYIRYKNRKKEKGVGSMANFS